KLSLSKKDFFTCSNPEIPTDSSNLVLKALSLFRLKTNIQSPVSIHLEKHIPHEAGLGGGSSNAATALFAFNELFNHPLSLLELQTFGASIGSDVPFFFSEGTAFCTGRGEIVQNLKPLETESLWIVKPKEGLKTPLIFKNLNADQLPKRDPNHFLRSFSTKKPQFFNDLEAPAFSLMPALKNLKEKLFSDGFETVLMSGSGSSFFCIGNPHSFDTKCFAFTCRADFLNREKKLWYKNKKALQ
ncbi:MAG TPA: 4-(cytidine 5'-diphospho)-2-C-methyl-D-erythritol kinase, partial [Parachlamydiaceae bacterium]|nr:4-(cytidine 5'-diphospho)-2-C-methyl-D-erythritol kinase [Parachlamydiaceae bacterium]